MEKVIAYKAFNGKLFLTEQDCIKYETEKQKYPLTKLIETIIEGNLGLKKIQERIYTSKSCFQKVKTYYQLPNKWKFECVTTCLSHANDKDLIGCVWHNASLGEFIIILFNQLPNIKYNDLISYLKYFYNGKIIVGHNKSDLNPYDIGSPIYAPITFEEAIKKPLPEFVKICADKNYFKIWDTRHHIGVTIFK